MLFESETFRGLSDTSDCLAKLLDAIPSKDSPAEIEDFEKLVKAELQAAQVPSELPLILRKFGWNGTRFIAEDEGNKIRFDLETIRAEFSGAYMRSICEVEVSANPKAKKTPSTVKKLVGFSESEITDDLVLQSYCPDILFQLFPKVSEPKSVSFFAACVLVDISGFTKLSSGFCQNGSQGLDDLHNNTSAFLGLFSDTIYEYGGDVIAFAGDALICIFRANDNDPPESAREGEGGGLSKVNPCLRALQCSFLLRGLRTEQLSCHVGVSCGDMSFGVLGGYKNKWTYLLNGPCIPELSSCLDDSKKQQVVVSASFYSMVEKYLDMDNTVVEHSLNTNNRKLLEMKINYPTSTSELRFQELLGTNLRERTAVAKLFVAKPVVDAIFTGQFMASMSELRDVTTVFINLDSYDHYTHRDPLTLQPFVTAVQKHLDKLGGFMRQFLIDDKGCVLIAMWGVPSFSYGNNEARALQFSHDLSGELSKLFHHCSIGITTGSVFCGNVGTSSRHDYVGIGHPVNLSARLMCKAQGRILIDETTYSRLPVQYQDKVRAAEVLRLKGVDAPMQSYKWTGRFGDYGGDEKGKDDEEGHFPELKDLNKMSTYEGGGGYTRRISNKRESLHTITDEPDEVDSGLAKEILDRVNGQLDRLDDMDRMSVLEDFQLQLKYRGDDVVAPAPTMAAPPIGKGYSLPTTMMQSTILDYLSIEKGHTLNNVTCTLLEGAGGTGKSKAAKYFIEAARNRCSRCVWIAGRLSDMSTPYGIFRKIITQLVGAENFNSENQQKVLFKRLLLMLYSNIAYTSAMLKEHLLLLNSALGLQWRRVGSADCNVSFVGLAATADTYAGNTISAAPRTLNGAVSYSAGPGSPGASYGPNNQQSFLGDTDDPDTDGVVDYTAKNRETVMLHKSMFTCKLISSVLALLLVKTPSVIVIENVQFADELSWKQIYNIMDMPCCLAMLLTVRTVGQNNSSNVVGYPSGTTNEADDDNSISFRSVKTKTSIMGYHSTSSNNSKVIPTNSAASSLSSSQGRGNGEAFSSRSAQRRMETIHAVRHDAYERVMQHPQVVKLVTMSLSRQDVEMFLIFTLDKDDIPGFIVDIVFELSNGNWYYIKKLTRFIFQRGTEEFIREMSSDHANHTLGLLAIFGFDSLKPQEKALMKTASVIGEEFYKDMLEALIPSALLPFVDQILDSMISNGLLICEDYDPPCYAFPSSQICSTLYDLIPRSEALQYHHKLSLFIENTYKDNLSQHYESLSYHTGFSTERISTAFKYDCLAADQQISIGGYGKALYLIKIAMTHAKSAVDMVMLRQIVECAAEDMFHLSNGELTATDESRGRRFLSRMSSLFSPSAIAEVLGGGSSGSNSRTPKKKMPTYNEGNDEDVGAPADEIIEAPSVTGIISPAWKRAYRRLLKIKKTLDLRIEAFREVKDIQSPGIDLTIIDPAVQLGWFPPYLEARTIEKESAKANKSTSIFSKYFNW